MGKEVTSSLSIKTRKLSIILNVTNFVNYDRNSTTRHGLKDTKVRKQSSEEIYILENNAV
jgi:hypothetical protein